MSVRIRILTFIMALLMLSGTLMGCKKDADAEQTESMLVSDVIADTETPLKEPVELTLFADGKSDYKYFIERKRNEVEPYVERLNKIFEVQFGTALESAANKDENVKKLIFEVVAMREEGTDLLDWSITAENGGDIVFRGNCVKAIGLAVDHFIAVKCQTMSGRLTLMSDMNVVYDYSENKIDNSSYLSWAGNQAALVSNGDLLQSPEWLSSLVMVEFRVDTASIGGTFDESYDMLEHYAKCGVNGVWLGIFYERGGGNGYSNVGPHRVEPLLSGVADGASDEAWNEVKEFIDYAHSLGIYVFMDVITWGVVKGSELTVAHPEWFDGEDWSGDAYDWTNEEFREWYISTVTENVMRTGADGLRCDCEPQYTGYDIFDKIRPANKSQVLK